MSYSCVQANKFLLLSPVARLSPREWNSGTSEMLLWSTAALLRPSVRRSTAVSRFDLCLDGEAATAAAAAISQGD